MTRRSSPPGRGSAFPHPKFTVPRSDAILAACVAVAVLAEAVLRGQGFLAALSGLIVAGSLAIRRDHPAIAVCVGWGGMLLTDLTARLLELPPNFLVTTIVSLELVRAAFRWSSRREFVLVGTWLVVCFAGVSALDGADTTEWVAGAAIVASCALLGVAQRFRAQAARSLQSRIRAEEREHLVRELHDTVGHHLSAIAIQSQAGQALLAGGSPDEAASTLVTIETEAVLTLTEMRALAGVLRGGDPDVDRSHRLADLDTLADPTGIPTVTVTVVDDLPPLPPMLESTVFRIAQESLTNVRRHARHAQSASVTVIHRDGQIRVNVRDDGQTSGPQRPGWGITGMRERVTLLGGSLTAEPAVDGGWEVHATLPLTPGQSRARTRR